jgi:hypothetical protein
MRTTEFVSEDAFASGTVERVELEFQILIGPRDPGVAKTQGFEFFLGNSLLDTRKEDGESRKMNRECFLRTKMRSF